MTGDGKFQHPTGTVPVEEAMARLDVIPDYDAGGGPRPCVHTFAQSSFGLLGAHWYVEDVRPFFEQHGVGEAGPAAKGSGHGLVVVADEGMRTLFFATRPEQGPEAA